MKEGIFTNRESQLELEKGKFGALGHEVAGLLAVKNPEELTQKTKLILARLGELASYSVAAVGGAGFAAGYIAMTGVLIQHVLGLGLVSDKQGEQIVMFAAGMGIPMMGGLFAAEKFEEIINRLESKRGKTQPA